MSAITVSSFSGVPVYIFDAETAPWYTSLEGAPCITGNFIQLTAEEVEGLGLDATPEPIAEEPVAEEPLDDVIAGLGPAFYKKTLPDLRAVKPYGNKPIRIPWMTRKNQDLWRKTIDIAEGRNQPPKAIHRIWSNTLKLIKAITSTTIVVPEFLIKAHMGELDSAKAWRPPGGWRPYPYPVPPVICTRY
jgi:hypothetical protein